MKYFLLILLITLTSNAKEFNLEGFKNPDEFTKGFFSELKKGKKGLDKALDSISSLNEEYERPNQEKNIKNKSFGEELRQVMVDDKQGKVTEYKMTQETVKFNGDMIKREYSVKFNGGKERTMLLIFYRPSLGSGYQIMDSKFND